MNDEKKKAIRILKTAQGQIGGIVKMIAEERYCIDISNQLFASSSLLKKANLLILKQHINTCVLEALSQDDGSEKIDEIIALLAKIIDK